MINSPFNYTGNKFKLLSQIIPLFNKSRTFVDVFAGGGSVYSNVCENYDFIIVNDIIKELIEIHKELIDNKEYFMKTVRTISPNKFDKYEYVQLRKRYNSEKKPEQLYALMLSCNNNMMRFNKKFEFNQTFGHRTLNNSTVKKVDEFSEHLKKYRSKIYFMSANFTEIQMIEDCMYYLDPPYSNTEAGYNAFWSKKNEEDLYGYIKKINEFGSSFMVSGLLGEHKDGQRCKLIDNLINDGFRYKVLDFDYEKVGKLKNKTSQEVVVYNYREGRYGT